MTSSWNQSNRQVVYMSHRPATDQRLASHFSYQPRGESRTAEPSSLEFFLIERYVLFADAGPQGLATGRVHHAPYEFRDADVTANTALFELNDTSPPGRPADHAVVSDQVEVEIFPLRTSLDGRT